MTAVLNLNVGLLGHVDSGKTSLAKALSEVASTAAFDKDPQSQARGITLDLGFSSFTIPIPSHLKEKCNYDKLQYTLVDCPGHASLIKTIIGGVQIIDMMLLVVDATKGIQTQTAECLVIGEITGKKMIVVINKLDLLEEVNRDKLIEKLKKKLEKTLSTTKFGNVPMVPVAACSQNGEKLGISELIQTISEQSFLPDRSRDGPFFFAVDHCFAIRGQGTVMTGTVLQGHISVNDTIEIPSLNATRKIKSMQMFKKPVMKALQGDRLGICVTQFEPKLLERGIVSSPGATSFIYCAVVSANVIKYFQNPISSKSKFHITIGYETVIASTTIFESKSKSTFDMASEYNYAETIDLNCNTTYYMILEFERPVLVTENSIVIGSKLDIDVNLKTCRLAFHGNLLSFSKDKDYRSTYLSHLKIYKTKTKTGLLERMVNRNSVIVKNMFKKESNVQIFVNLKVTLSTGEEGIIEGPFGQSGKIKVYIRDGLSDKTADLLQRNKTNIDNGTDKDMIYVNLSFKKFLFDNKKLVIQ